MTPQTATYRDREGQASVPFTSLPSLKKKARVSRYHNTAMLISWAGLRTQYLCEEVRVNGAHGKVHKSLIFHEELQE